MTAPLAPADLLTRLLRDDPGRPFVTYYDRARGGRVELSRATFDNWVAKTAGLLDDEAGVVAGDVVDVDLPAHWLGLVLTQAVWTLGASLAFGEPKDAALVVTSIDGADPARGRVDGPPVMVVGTLPLGGPAVPSAPAGAIDLGRDALGYPDVLTAPVSTSDDPLLAHDVPSVARGARRLVAAHRLDATVVVEALLVPLTSDGSVVLVQVPSERGEETPDQLAAIADQEKAVEVVTTGRR